MVMKNLISDLEFVLETLKSSSLTEEQRIALEKLSKPVARCRKKIEEPTKEDGDTGSSYFYCIEGS
jgi:hypothetical protein